MLSKCANPECFAPFHYLREGKLFQMELRTAKPTNPEPRLVGAGNGRNVEHFWLCGTCSQKMTLAFEPAQGVVIIPLKKTSAIRRAAAS
jgi:hypothetical protein